LSLYEEDYAGREGFDRLTAGSESLFRLKPGNGTAFARSSQRFGNAVPLPGFNLNRDSDPAVNLSKPTRASAPTRLYRSTTSMLRMRMQPEDAAWPIRSGSS
jgi:hypothetical protein